MNGINKAEFPLSLARRFGLIAPVVEATFVDGKEVITSFRAGSQDKLREDFLSAMALLETLGVKSKNGNIAYASGYAVLGLDFLPLLHRRELGQNPKGFEKAWVLLGDA